MANLKVFIFLTVIRSFVSSTDSVNFCPEYCVCDLFNGRNQANCSGRNLLNGFVEVPIELEILDLSNNEIMELDKFCFQNYSNLIEVNLAHNAIKSIDLYTFVQLRIVETINLSYNHLEYIDNRLFEMNRRLYTLNLEGNKFMMLSNEPLIKSLPLRTLNLRNCQLNFLEVQFFTALPQLQNLDISYNLFITLNIETFSTCNQLLKLNIVGNLWNCDNVEHDVKNLRGRHIEVSFNDCENYEIEKSEVHKFERLQLPPNELEDLKVRSDTPMPKPRPQWRRIFHEDELDEEIGTKDLGKYVCESSLPARCVRYRNCLADKAKILEERILKYTNLKTAEHNEQELNLAFLLGIAAGVTTIVIILTGALCFKACMEVKKNPPVIGSDGEVVPATQIPQRIRRSRRRGTTSQALARRDQIYATDSDNFIARLFGRPVRRQYYRTINQNTATLIRRLSRSNLFNNRLSPNFERERSTTESVYVRPETPPPTYGEVIVINNEN